MAETPKEVTVEVRVDGERALASMQEMLLDEMKTRMDGFTPEMLVHMSEWCTKRARDKTLTPEDDSFRPYLGNYA